MPSDVDKAFDLIQEGNALEKAGNHWGASYSYANAMTLLQKLADDTSPSKEEEQAKIHKLYEAKANEYRIEARKCLLQALQQEYEQEKTTGSSIISQNLDDEEAQQRVYTFCTLFSKSKEDPASVASLEERLMELNASLPSGFKTSWERMKDLNRRLGGFGLSLYSNHNNNNEPELDEDEQVSQIIAQAKDHVQYSKPKDEDNNDNSAAVMEDDASLSSSNDDDDSIDVEELDDPHLQKRHAVRKRVVKAQVTLAQVIALLEDDEKADDLNELQDENESDDESELNTVRESLKKARNYLSKALKECSTGVS